MKNKRNKLTNFFKTGVLLFGISLLLWNCEDQTTESLPENTELNKFNTLINTKLISQELGLGEDNIVIKWHDPSILHLEKNNQGGWYQYNIELKKEVPNNSNLFVDKLTFKLLIKEQQGVVEDIQILRYEPFKESLNTNPSELNTKGFSGMKFLFNELGQMLDIFTYLKGEKISSFNETKSERKGKHKNILFPSMDDSDFNECLDLNGNPIEGCTSSGGSGSGGGGGYVTETTYHYTDWYNRCDTCTSNDGQIFTYGGVNYIYVHTKYDGATTRWVWVSRGGDRYVDVYHSQSPSGGAPTYDGENRNYSGSSSGDDHDIPCPIGYEKVGDVCVKALEEDKIDASQLTGKADCVYQKMVGGNNNINWILENFEDNNQPSEFNLRFEMSTSLSSLTNASTIKSGNTFIIKINQYRAENINTTLTIARTILHEGIHARLREFASRQGSNETSFPGVYDYFRRFEKNWDHQKMAAHYRSTIAQGLKQYDKGQHSDAFYDALAWEGLSEIKDLNGNQETIYTEAWKELSPSAQQKVLDIITEEKQNGNKTCQ